MSLTTTVRNRLMDAVNMAFAAVGMTTETKMPRTKRGDNRGPVAWEYFIASHLSALATARLKAAKQAAVDAGVIFDHEKFPREAGTNEPVYTGDQVAVWLTVSTPSIRVNPDKMCEFLIADGVAPKKVADAYAKATVKTRPAHTFRVSLVASDTTGK